MTIGIPYLADPSPAYMPHHLHALQMLVPSLANKRWRNILQIERVLNYYVQFSIPFCNLRKCFSVEQFVLNVNVPNNFTLLETLYLDILRDTMLRHPKLPTLTLILAIDHVILYIILQRLFFYTALMSAES